MAITFGVRGPRVGLASGGNVTFNTPASGDKLYCLIYYSSVTTITFNRAGWKQVAGGTAFESAATGHALWEYTGGRADFATHQITATGTPTWWGVPFTLFGTNIVVEKNAATSVASGATAIACPAVGAPRAAGLAVLLGSWRVGSNSTVIKGNVPAGFTERIDNNVQSGNGANPVDVAGDAVISSTASRLLYMADAPVASGAAVASQGIPMTTAVAGAMSASTIVFVEAGTLPAGFYPRDVTNPRYNTTASANQPGDLPANVAEGDLLVVHLHSNNGASTLTNAQGFTVQANEQSTSGGRGFILTKIASAAEAAASGVVGALGYWTFVIGGTASTGTLTSFRVPGIAGSGAAGVEAASFFGVASGTSKTIPGVTTLGPNRLVVWFMDSNAIFTPTTWPTPPSQQNVLYENTQARSVVAAWEIAAAQGATGNRVVSTLSQPTNVFGIAIEPAPTVVRTPQESTRASSYAVRAPASSTRASAYAARKNVSATRASLYAVRFVATPSSRASSYAVRFAASLARTSAYQVRRNATPATRASSYAVRFPATAPRGSAYAVRGTSQASRQSAFAVLRAATPAQRSSAFEVQYKAPPPPPYLIGSVASTSLTTTPTPQINMPPGIKEEEKIVVFIRLAGAQPVVPLVDDQGFAVRAHVYQGGRDQEIVLEKTASASEPASYTFGFANTSPVQAAAFRVTSDTGTPIFDAQVATIDLSAAPYTHPGLITTRSNSLVLYGAGSNSNVTYAWADPTLEANEIYDAGGGTNRSLAVSWLQQAPSGQSVASNVTPSADPASASVGMSAVSFYSPSGPIRAESLRTSSYALRTPQSAGRASAYAVRIGQAPSRTSSYKIFLSVSATRQSAYAVRLAVMGARASFYKIRANVLSTRASSYRVMADDSAPATPTGFRVIKRVVA